MNTDVNTSSCPRPDLRERLFDLLMGEIDAASDAGREILAHADACDECGASRAATDRMIRDLRAHEPWSHAMPHAMPAGAPDLVGRGASVRGGDSGGWGPGRPRWFRGALAVAASIGAVALGTAVLLPSLLRARVEAPHPMPPGAREALNTPAPKADADVRPVDRDVPAPGVGAGSRIEIPAPARQAMSESRLAPAPEGDRRAKEESEKLQGGYLANPAAVVAEAQSAAAKRAADVADAVRRSEGGVETGVEGGVVGGVAGGGVVGGVIGGALTVSPSSPDLPRTDLPREERRTQRPRDMFFDDKGVNPFVSTGEDPRATFGLDVDTASYTIARNYLRRGQLPPAAAVRVEEFVNAFPDARPAPRGDGVFSVRVEGAPNPLREETHFVRVALQTRAANDRDRRPARLTFVIDVSGSMNMENRLGLVKRSLALLVDKLDERDTIGIVVYGTNGRRVLDQTPVDERGRDRILSVIERLSPEGSTNLDEGLRLGYEMARDSYERGGNNRVILCTDGVANEGETAARKLIARIRSSSNRGIDMIALGFGMGNYNDALLQRLADEGNGQYAYVDTDDEARVFFLRNLANVLDVVARDAKAQVEFNPARVLSYRLVGYEKRDVADRDFRNDAVDAGEINAGHAVTALFEVKLRETRRASDDARGYVRGDGALGTVRVRYRPAGRGEATEFSREIRDGDFAPSYERASDAFHVAFVAARFAEHLRSSHWVRNETLRSVAELADRLPETVAAAELSDLVHRAARLAGESDGHRDRDRW